MIVPAVLFAAFTVHGGAGAGRWDQLQLSSDGPKPPAPAYRPFVYGRFEWVPSSLPLRLDLSLTAYSSVNRAGLTGEGLLWAGIDFGPHPWRHGPRVGVGLVDPAVGAHYPHVGMTVGLAYRLGIPLWGGWLHVDPEASAGGQGEIYRELRVRIGYEWRVL